MAISPIVWTYWEGPKPFYIERCLLRASQICNSFTLVTPENISEYLLKGVLTEKYLLLSQPALRADAIRAALLAIHGGFWFDADTVLLRNPTELIESGDSVLYTCWDRPPIRVPNGYIYIPPSHPVAERWLEAVNREVSRDPYAVDWCAIGEKFLTPLVFSTANAIFVPRSVFLPIDIDSSVKEFFTPQSYKKYLTEETVCFGLNHSWFMYHRKADILLNSAEWKKSPLLIHQLFHDLLL